MASLLPVLLLQAAAAPVRAETLLVRPVAMPTPWYDVATGVLAIVAILLLLTVVAMLVGAARAMKGAESAIARKFDTLSAELVPVLRRLHEVTGDLQEITRGVKGEMARVSGTVGAVDESVRGLLGATEERVARVAALVDQVTEEAEQTVADARGLLAGVRGGARGLVSTLARGTAKAKRPRGGTPRGTPTVPPPRDVVDEEDEEWHAPPLARSAGVRARRTPIAAPADTADDHDAWDAEADALIAEAERALGRTFASERRPPRDGETSTERPPRPAAAPNGPRRAGGPRLKGRPDA